MTPWKKRQLIRSYLRYWSLRLVPGWEVRWTTGKVEGGKNGHPPYGHAEAFPNYEKKRVFIRFNLRWMTSEEKIERTVIHELFHCLTGEEESKEEHQMIRRLEKPIRRIRLRVGQVVV